MRLILIVIIFFFILNVKCSAIDSYFIWNDSLYSAYNYDTFFKLPEVNKEINLNSIDYSLLNAVLFYQTNKYRVEYGRTEFKYSRALEKAAFEHSSNMGQLKFYDHESIIETKKFLWQRLIMVGINEDASYGENIATYNTYIYLVCELSIDNSTDLKRNRSFKSYADIADYFLCLWMTSKGHFDNIINAYSLEYLGCGIYFDKETETFYGTQDFSSEDADNQKFNNTINYDYKSPK
jgi:uncharacterized protein YkwD